MLRTMLPPDAPWVGVDPCRSGQRVRRCLRLVRDRAERSGDRSRRPFGRVRRGGVRPAATRTRTRGRRVRGRGRLTGRRTIRRAGARIAGGGRRRPGLPVRLLDGQQYHNCHGADDQHDRNGQPPTPGRVDEAPATPVPGFGGAPGDPTLSIVSAHDVPLCTLLTPTPERSTTAPGRFRSRFQPPAQRSAQILAVLQPWHREVTVSRFGRRGPTRPDAGERRAAPTCRARFWLSNLRYPGLAHRPSLAGIDDRVPGGAQRPVRPHDRGPGATEHAPRLGVQARPGANWLRAGSATPRSWTCPVAGSTGDSLPPEARSSRWTLVVLDVSVWSRAAKAPLAEIAPCGPPACLVWVWRT